MSHKIQIGKLQTSKDLFEQSLLENTHGSENTNHLVLCQQGGGKTNLLMLLVDNIYRAYMESDGEYGAIPIIFSPLFEFDRLRIASDNTNLPYDTEPMGLDTISFSFKIADPPPDPNIRMVAFRFRDLTVEDIASFAGYTDNNAVLGNIQKLLLKIRRLNPHYTIDDFLVEVEDEKSLKDALFYVFSKLKDGGLFDDDVEAFDWYPILRERKPVVFNFGTINTRDLYSSITAILLRKLWDLSYEYDSAMSKKFRIQDGAHEELTEKEEWLVKYFYIGLMFEEAHQIFWNTTSTQLQSFPAHYVYKQISDLLGRKKGFKYNFLITQRIMELYKYFRQQQHVLWLGSKLYQEDKEYMVKEMKFPKDEIVPITILAKYSFAVIDVNNYKNRRRGSVNKVLVFRSPCGQPKMRE